MYFNKLAMDIVRAARLVGIPKDGGSGVRPIVISSFFGKLAGTLVLKRAKIAPLPMQYAISCRDGALTIVYRTRDHFNKGLAIVRMDLSNAYNVLKRKRALEELIERGYDKDIITYFRTMYEPTSAMIMFGPGGETRTIAASEGVRQGDAPSSFFFCVVLQRVCEELKREFPDADLSAFMDDTTIAIDKSRVHEVAPSSTRAPSSAATRSRRRPTRRRRRSSC